MAEDRLERAIERYHSAGAEIVNGNPEPQKALFSRSDDVTLVNPVGVVARGWAEVAATVERASAPFTDGEIDFERIAEQVTPALACIVEIERWRARVEGRDDISSGELRVTSILRPEGDTWKVVHRHADPIRPSPPGAPSGEGAARPIVLRAGEGISVVNPVGGVLTFKTTSDQSAGTLTVIDTVAAPGEGPPLHVHRHEDEFIYTLNGRFRIKLAEELIEADPGSFVFIPRGTPHTWQNIGAAPARFLAAVTPATVEFEQFFLRYAELPGDQRGIAAFSRLAAETRAFEVLGPPLAQSDPQSLTNQKSQRS